MKLISYINLARPKQWLKNLMVLFPPLLGGTINQDGVVWLCVVPLLSFCMASSFSYVVNDIVDLKKDQCHPIKKFRPIASEDISRTNASVYATFLLFFGIIFGYYVSQNFLLYLIAYLTVSLLYSFYLKRIPLVDMFCISFGFLIRLQAGGVVFDIEVSSWLFLSVFLLSLFLSTGKRISEIKALGVTAGGHRESLAGYPQGFLDNVMYMTGAVVLVTYSMYSIVHSYLIYTVPLCTFGLLRYMMRVQSGENGDPTESLLYDPFLFIVSITWLLSVVYTIYLV